MMDNDLGNGRMQKLFEGWEDTVLWAWPGADLENAKRNGPLPQARWPEGELKVQKRNLLRGQWPLPAEPESSSETPAMMDILINAAESSSCRPGVASGSIISRALRAALSFKGIRAAVSAAAAWAAKEPISARRMKSSVSSFSMMAILRLRGRKLPTSRDEKASG